MELSKQNIQPQYYPVVVNQPPPVYSQLPIYSNPINPISTIRDISSQPFVFPSIIRVELVNNVNAQREWSTGIFDCCIHASSCITGLFCPCVLYGKNVENITNGQSGCCCSALCCCILPCSAFIRGPIRRKIRNQYNLQSEPCNDLCVSMFCPSCALCQEYRELAYRRDNPDGPRKQFMV
jgi:Cys-rich protein (TIGR01571 family)